MKVLGNINVDLDVVNKDYVDGEISKINDESPFVISTNPPENKKTLWIKDDNERDITKKIGSFHPSAIYTGSMELLGVVEKEYNVGIQISDTSKLEKLNQRELIIDIENKIFKADKFYCVKDQFLCLAFNNENDFIFHLNDISTPGKSAPNLYVYALLGEEVKISIVTGQEEYSTLHYYHDIKKTWQTFG